MKLLHSTALLGVGLLALSACSKAPVATVTPAPTLDARTQAFAGLPDWRGIWIAENSFELGISGFASDMGQPGAKPHVLIDPAGPWTDAARQRMAAMFADSTSRKALGWGYPMMMAGPAPLQFVITPEETVIINIYQEVRHIYTDGRAHPPLEDRWVTTWGDSIGHWEGDTLVIDTVSVREPIKYFQMVPPFSDEAHYVERLRLTAPDRIETEITVEDPQSLRQPWTVKTAYKKTPNLDRLLHDAFENDRNELEGDTFTILPTKAE
jgi:hypothetical protein